MSFLLTKTIAVHLFEAFSIQRWNDRIRLISLNEMDKNAYKSMLAYFLGKKYAEQAGVDINWMSLIDRLTFDLVVRISTSDIASHMHGRLREHKQDYVKALHSLLDNDLSEKIHTDKFLKDLKDYVANNFVENLVIEDNILRLAHNISVQKEYEIISSVQYNCCLPDHQERLEEIGSEVKHYSEKLRLNKYINSPEFKKLMYSIDSLRFQKRWSQTQRVPETNVLGHSFYVALLYYFSSRYLISNHKDFTNNFWAALMHDFLESYTRDVISTVKNSSEHFSNIIHQVEEEMLSQRLEPLLDPAFLEHFKFLITEEFKKRMLVNGEIRKITDEESAVNPSDRIDGVIVKVCDSLAALIEAHQSIDMGTNSHHLQGAVTRVYAVFQKMKVDIDDEDLAKGFQKIYDEFITS